MASAQVMPNPAASKRDEILLKGRQKLEEFRKNKAGGRAKKAAPPRQLQPADVDQHEKLSQKSEDVGDRSIAMIGSSSITGPSEISTVHDAGEVSSSPSIDIGSSNHAYATSADLVNHGHVSYGDANQGKPSELYRSSEPTSGYYGHVGENNQFSHNTGVSFEHSEARMSKASDSVSTNPNIDVDTSNLRSQFGGNKKSSKLNVRDHDPSGTYFRSTLPARSDISGDIVNVSKSVGINSNFDADINNSRYQFGSQHGESRKPSVFTVGDHDCSGTSMSTSTEMSGDSLAQNRLGFPSTAARMYGLNGDTAVGVEQSIRGSMNHESFFGGRKSTDSTSHNIKLDSAYWHTSDPPFADVSFPAKSFSNQQPFPLNDFGTTSGRSRPSFLDSIGLPKVSSTSHAPYDDLPKANQPISVTNTEFQNTKALSSLSEQSHNWKTPDKDYLYMNSSVTLNDGQPSNLAVSDHLHQSHDLQTQKKDEDFAALEQYIEDLTQEKFSLQRALETSRGLAESLAAENSSLTESYNQQGQVLNQLQSDIDRMQEEVKAQLLVLESLKSECTNAQLECNAADERAKILATEVISLEEKALRLRSNELKLEKQLGTMTSEISSYMYKVSSLEKERQDFRSTIDAMLEEKKLLQSKLRKASVSGKSDISATSTKKDVFTSTEDLGGGHLDEETDVAEVSHEITPFLPLSRESSSRSLFPEAGRSPLPDASGIIPGDQLRMIDNINSLTSELALEKQELIRALRVESANSSKLKDLNKDLSQKLESQTQRLELLTAQRMANENILTKPMEIHSVHDTPAYADEGDEVVERVLSWIMKLFPGGPSKRRTSRLL